MERTYEVSLTVRCAVAAPNKREADAAAQQFAELLGGWIDGSVGNSPFDYHVAVSQAAATRRDFEWEYAPLTPAEIAGFYRSL
jgi:hypothetical protein